MDTDKHRWLLSAVICVHLWLIPASARVKTGLDVLVEQKFAPLAGKRVGLITNHSGLTYDRRHIVDVLAAAPGVKLVAVFTPEHGIAGTRDDENVESSTHPKLGIPVHSLHFKGRYRPTPEMLKGVDVLVYDIQDVGARFYTYITTLGYCLEEAAKAKIPFYVLDRPNPITGAAVDGPPIDAKNFSFVGYTVMPTRHGMTIGELARMYNGEKKLGADLHVIEMQGWRRSMWLDDTGLEWRNPSPALRSLTATIMYTGTCLMEGREVSVGRGTAKPFELVGAPWFKGHEVTDYLNSLKIPGVSFLNVRFTPSESDLKGQECDGVEVQLLDRNKLDNGLLGLSMAAAIMKFHPGKFTPRITLLGSDDALARLKRGESGATIVASYQKDLQAFRQMREKYLLYK